MQPDKIHLTLRGNDMGFTIREARLEDAKRLVEIYSYYVENTAVSFEYKVPTVEEFERRIETIKKRYPYLVCEDEGKVVGYAYADMYGVREAFNWSATTSIYIDKDYRRKGIGSLLYDALEKAAKERGIVNLFAVVAYADKEDENLSKDSSKFHTQYGYEEVGRMKSIGKKFDKWYDLIYYQKRL